MPARGLSMAEKKVKMLEIFHESSEFYTLKELEKLGPKLKGVISQSVKEVVEDLISDGLVRMEKIGTSNYFWSFPSAAGAQKQAALDKAQKELKDASSKIEETKKQLSVALKGREDTTDRRALLSTLAQLKQESSELKAELDAFGAADPVKYERKKEGIQTCRDAASRWTGELALSHKFSHGSPCSDNTMILLSYAVGMGMVQDQESMKAMLGITDDWEDLPV